MRKRKMLWYTGSFLNVWFSLHLKRKKADCYFSCCLRQESKSTPKRSGGSWKRKNNKPLKGPQKLLTWYQVMWTLNILSCSSLAISLMEFLNLLYLEIYSADSLWLETTAPPEREIYQVRRWSLLLSRLGARNTL